MVVLCYDYILIHTARAPPLVVTTVVIVAVVVALHFNIIIIR